MGYVKDMDNYFYLYADEEDVYHELYSILNSKYKNNEPIPQGLWDSYVYHTPHWEVYSAGRMNHEPYLLANKVDKLTTEWGNKLVDHNNSLLIKKWRDVGDTPTVRDIKGFMTIYNDFKRLTGRKMYVDCGRIFEGIVTNLTKYYAKVDFNNGRKPTTSGYYKEMALKNQDPNVFIELGNLIQYIWGKGEDGEEESFLEKNMNIASVPIVTMDIRLGMELYYRASLQDNKHRPELIDIKKIEKPLANIKETCYTGN